MNAIRGTMLGLVVALGTLATSAQDNTIPLKQIEKDAQNLQLSARAAVPDNEAAVEHANAMLSGSSSSAAGLVLPAPAPGFRELSVRASSCLTERTWAWRSSMWR